MIRGKLYPLTHSSLSAAAPHSSCQKMISCSHASFIVYYLQVSILIDQFNQLLYITLPTLTSLILHNAMEAI